jgi:hypothetical protein
MFPVAVKKGCKHLVLLMLPEVVKRWQHMLYTNVSR